MLTQALKQRGYEIISQGDDRDILLPKITDKVVKDCMKDMLYTLISDERLRKSFRDWTYETIKARIPKVVRAYMSLCKYYDKSFVEIERDKDKKVLKYSHTFEWYISELMRREFGAKESGFNIRLTEMGHKDEFDCISLIDDGLVFVECKTGKGAIFKEIEKFVRRDEELGADYSFFIFDRNYTFKEDLVEDIPNIKKVDAKKLGLDRLTKVVLGDVSFYSILSGKRYFFVSSGFDNLEKRLRLMIRHIWLERHGADARKTFSEKIISFAD